MTIARMPLAKELADFAFADTPINEGLVRDLANGGFLASQRNVVLVGGTGTGKTHLAIAIARACTLSVVDWRPVGLRFTNDLAIGWNARSYSRLNATVAIARYAERYHLRIFVPIIAVLAVSLFVLWSPGLNEQDKGGFIFSSLLALAASSFTFESSFPGSISLNTPVAEMISLGYLYLVAVRMFEIALSDAIAHPSFRWRGQAADLRWHLRWAIPAMMLIICIGAAVRALPA